MKEQVLDLLVGVLFFVVMGILARLIYLLFGTYTEYVILGIFGIWLLFICKGIGNAIRREVRYKMEERAVRKIIEQNNKY